MKKNNSLEQYAIGILNRISSDLDAEEGFSQELIDFVDLDIEYSPVIAFRGEGLGQEVKAIPTTSGNRYIVQHPAITSSVGIDELKRMRLRYLLAFKRWQRIQYAPLIKKLGG